MGFFNRWSHTFKDDVARLQAVELKDAPVMHPEEWDYYSRLTRDPVLAEKANPHRHGSGNGQFSTAEDSRVGTGASDPKSPHYTPYHLVRDPEPNPKNTYRVHHGDQPLTESMPRSQAANEYAKMLEKARPYVEQNSNRTSTENGGKGKNKGRSEERGNVTG